MQVCDYENGIEDCRMLDITAGESANFSNTIIPAILLSDFFYVFLERDAENFFSGGKAV